jgi:hypothetical protein
MVMARLDTGAIRNPRPELKSTSNPAKACVSYTQMKKNNGQISPVRSSMNYAATAIGQMELYCTAHSGSPSAIRRPQLFFHSELWIALLGPSVEEGIVGIGPTVAAALRAFDAQYYAGLRPSVECVGRVGALRLSNCGVQFE